MVPRDWGGHPARLIDESDAKDREWLDRVREYRQQALAGRPLPIRRWKAAVGGQTATSGKGKADTDWNAVWSRSVRSLRHAFEHWSEVKRMEESLPPAWTNEMAAWDEMAASIPEELFPALYRRVFNQSAPELKRLINALKDKLKTIEE